MTPAPKPASVTPPETWNYAANEIRREASIRGDLDERTVQALAAHLDRISMGYSEPNLARDARHAQQRAKARPGCVVVTAASAASEVEAIHRLNAFTWAGRRAECALTSEFLPTTGSSQTWDGVTCADCLSQKPDPEASS